MQYHAEHHAIASKTRHKISTQAEYPVHNHSLLGHFL